jgi:3-methylcrotonyl-CoA carboxylase alpha subunit
MFKLHHDELFRVDPVPNEVLAQAAVNLSQPSASTSAGVWGSEGLMNRRFGDIPETKVILDGQEIRVQPQQSGLDGSRTRTFKVSIGDWETTLSSSTSTPSSAIASGSLEYIAQFPHTRQIATIIPSSSSSSSNKLHLFTNSKHYTLLLPKAEEELSSSTTSSDKLTAPMPATVIEVRVKPGDNVTEGQVCCVLESMKMEISIRAGRDGVVGQVGVVGGQSVEEGMLLVALSPKAEGDGEGGKSG